MEAISHGLTILSWFENNAEKDMPDENIWDDSEGLEEHWKAIRLREAGGLSSTADSDEQPDDDSGDFGPDVLGNDLADVFKN
jgi:hypothetical protein